MEFSIIVTPFCEADGVSGTGKTLKTFDIDRAANFVPSLGKLTEIRDVILQEFWDYVAKAEAPVASAMASCDVATEAVKAAEAESAAAQLRVEAASEKELESRQEQEKAINDSVRLLRLARAEAERVYLVAQQKIDPAR